jgi:hypothetical protein
MGIMVGKSASNSVAPQLMFEPSPTDGVGLFSTGGDGFYDVELEDGYDSDKKSVTQSRRTTRTTVHARLPKVGTKINRDNNQIMTNNLFCYPDKLSAVTNVVKSPDLNTSRLNTANRPNLNAIAIQNHNFSPPT